MRSRIALVTVPLLLATLALASDSLRASAHERYLSGQRYEDAYYLPPPEWLRVFSAGFDEALADFVWMKALVNFGDELQHQGQAEHVFDYTEAMLALDPHFRAAYLWIGTAGLYRLGAVTPADVERSVAIMQRGARVFPEDGELAWSIGAALTFELVPLLESREEQDRARERGLPYLMQAVRLHAAPEWAALTNASMLARLGRTEQAARHLEEMYLSVDDPDERARLADRIRQLRASADAEAFVAAMEELERRRREELPYVPAGLYLELGPRPPVDIVTPIRDGLPAALARPEDEP